MDDKPLTITYRPTPPTPLSFPQGERDAIRAVVLKELAACQRPSGISPNADAKKNTL